MKITERATLTQGILRRCLFGCEDQERLNMQPIMKVSTVLLVLTILRWGNAFFDRPFGDEFPLTNTITCDNRIPQANLNYSHSDPQVGAESFRARPSGFRVPRGIQSMSLRDQLPFLQALGSDFNRTLQDVNPRSGDSPPVCEDFDTDDDQLTPSEIVNLFVDRYNEENFTSSDRYLIQTTDGQSLFRRTLVVLQCRVAFQWVDAGPTYIPRYYSAGFCINRRCSLPDREDMLCRPDLDSQMGALHAFRWDCCWEPPPEVEPLRRGKRLIRHPIFNCGWRRVTIPIVCDCDCECSRLQ